MFFSRRVTDRRDISAGAYILAALLLAVTVAVLSACGDSGPTATPTTPGTGTVSGTISVGPLCPVEPCTNPNNPYVGLNVIISDAAAVIRAVEVADGGSYSATIPVGNYEITLQPCQWLGCQHGTLPEHVTVQVDETTVLNISIDTGIR
jgi:hypothetical protein